MRDLEKIDFNLNNNHMVNDGNVILFLLMVSKCHERGRCILFWIHLHLFCVKHYSWLCLPKYHLHSHNWSLWTKKYHPFKILKVKTGKHILILIKRLKGYRNIDYIVLTSLAHGGENKELVWMKVVIIWRSKSRCSVLFGLLMASCLNCPDRRPCMKWK